MNVVKQLKDAVFAIVGAAIAWGVAGKPDGTLRWWMILLGALVAYATIGMLVKLSWSRYRRRSN